MGGGCGGTATGYGDIGYTLRSLIASLGSTKVIKG
jgi:hypothetical protein